MFLSICTELFPRTELRKELTINRSQSEADTTNKEFYQYARLRCGKGKALANGSKSQYIPVKEIPYYKAAISRGKQLTKLEKQISQLQQKLGTTY